MTGIHLTVQTSAGWLWAISFFLFAIPAIAIIGGLIFTIVLKFWVPVACGLAIAGLSVGIFIWANWPPFSMQYHRFVPTTFTVKEIANRFIASDTDGGGSTQRFVLLGTDNMPYACDDTRCALVTKGEVLTLMCVRQYEQNGIPGYACNWGEVGKNG